MLELQPLHPLFGAEVAGVNLTRALDDATFDAVKDALDEHSFLVFRNQPIDDVMQIAFSARFGRLEKTRAGARGEGRKLVVLSNLDATGQMLPPNDHQLFHAKANQLWHSDASFRPVPAYASVLSGRKVARCGGETEFVSMRAAYTSLDSAMRVQVEQLEAIHDFSHSRATVEPGRLTRLEADDLPAVKHPLVRYHSATQAPALFIGSHVREILGVSADASAALLEQLTVHATREECILAHRWQPFDLIIWDNSAVMHRGQPWDVSESRHLKRATVADDGYREGVLAAA